MDKGIVIAGGVVLVGALLMGNMPDTGVSGGGSSYPLPLGLASGKKDSTPITESTIINLPAEEVTFPEIELPSITLPSISEVRKRPVSYSVGSGKKIKETALMKEIRRTGRTPTVDITSPAVTSHVRGKKTAPSPIKDVSLPTTTLTQAPSAPAPAPIKVTKAPSAPMIYVSPFESTAPKKATTPAPKRSWWSEFIGGFKTGLFGGR